MKKAAIIVVLVVIAGIGGWYLGHRREATSTKQEPVKVAPTVDHPDASNATFLFEDGPVTLKKGAATTDVTPNGEVTQDTTLTDDIAYGDINKDGKTDTAVLLVQSGSGSGIFLYVGAYLSGVVTYKGSNTVFIGDRVTPKSVSVDKSGVITVTYLDRRANEPLAADPTVLTTKRFVYANSQLEEK
ncbi:YdgA family protein [Candidatus Parcubacteria bacterium]|nr:YdgA family protein [Candidatus Parcubacteria bacterium]